MKGETISSLRLELRRERTHRSVLVDALRNIRRELERVNGAAVGNGEVDAALRASIRQATDALNKK
jgi:hypothetical protein